MTLEDFLGKTSEIKIIDFLSGNTDTSYCIDEISLLSGIRWDIVHRTIPKLIDNGIIEKKEKRNNIDYYQLADNKIVKALIGAVFAHSFYIASQDD